MLRKIKKIDKEMSCFIFKLKTMTIPKQSEKLLDRSYPSYIKTVRTISGKGTDVNLNDREFNHICMKHVYDHFSNRQSIRKVGAMINERGGLEQVQINFSCL